VCGKTFPRPLLLPVDDLSAQFATGSTRSANPRRRAIGYVVLEHFAGEKLPQGATRRTLQLRPHPRPRRSVRGHGVARRQSLICFRQHPRRARCDDCAGTIGAASRVPSRCWRQRRCAMAAAMSRRQQPSSTAKASGGYSTVFLPTLPLRSLCDRSSMQRR
jgi:hypothetical protein